jgi:glycosyltransferase involved in cell wall biosynthesis
MLKIKHPQTKSIEIVLFGKNNSLDCTILPYPAVDLGVISSQQDLIELYNIADVFVLPSLEDNLPNMVMEAMSCGIPVVAFNQGGIPEMIDHQQNGYIAKYCSSEDLSEGIYWCLSQNQMDIKTNARKKVIKNYSEEVISQKYLKAYQSLLN